MLQMALKMATELDEPAVDLEGALTANTITASQNAENQSGIAFLYSCRKIFTWQFFAIDLLILF